MRDLGRFQEGWLGPYPRRTPKAPSAPAPDPEPALDASDGAPDAHDLTPDDPAPDAPAPVARPNDAPVARPAPRRRPRRTSEQVWERVRDDYLAGVTAPECGRRWGVIVSTLRARARKEGWRLIDQPLGPDPDPLPLDAPLMDDDADDPDDVAAFGPPDGPADYAGMAHRVLARFERALRRGAATEAATWLRLHARLLDLARVPPPPPEPAAPDPIDQLSACVREIEAIARDAAGVDDDDLSAQAALDARAAAVHARILAVTGQDAASLIDSMDSIDPLFSNGTAGPSAAADHPP